MAIRTLSEHSVRMATHFFVNFDVFSCLYQSCCISVITSLINTKLGDFVNFGMLFLTTLINLLIP